MSKTKLLLDLVDCLRNLTGTLEEITACVAGNELTVSEQDNHRTEEPLQRCTTESMAG